MSELFSNLNVGSAVGFIPRRRIHVCDSTSAPWRRLRLELIKKRISRKAIESRAPQHVALSGAPPSTASDGRPSGRLHPAGEGGRWRAPSASASSHQNDTVISPTLSFKDRVVAVASPAPRNSASRSSPALDRHLATASPPTPPARPQELRPDPGRLEQSKVSTASSTAPRYRHPGPYDQVNRLCSRSRAKYGWGFVNRQPPALLREGSKTMGFEIVEQLGWKIPRHTVVPMASGSSSPKRSPRPTRRR